MLETSDGLPHIHQLAYDLGVKLASTPEPAYNLTGMLFLSVKKDKPWLHLSVPTALVRGTFDAMTEPGIELPPGPEGRLVAHISVVRPEEIAAVGGPAKFINDRGKQFTYTLGRLIAIIPDGYADIEKCWAIRVHSVQLQQLRRSYGLSSLPNDGKYDFHITVAVRRRGVLGRGAAVKATAPA